MVSDLSQLESSYLNSCKKQDVLPNLSILSSFSKVRHQMQDHCVLEIFIDQLMSSDFPPLIDALSPICLSGISAVDVCQKSSDISLNGEHVLSLLHAVNHKLRLVDLIDWSSWKNILQDICQRRLRCQVLKLQFSPIRKLNMNGNFLHLQTLNLDYSIHLTSFQVNCFSCMPNLMHLSMCATSITNLWTTSAALLKLPSLMELRFQKCFCCYGTGPCPKSVEESSTYMLRKINTGQLHQYSSTRSPSFMSENISRPNLEYPINETTGELCYDDDSFTNQEMLQRTTEELTNESDLFFSSNRQAVGDWLDEKSSDVFMSPSDQNVSFNCSAPVPTDYQLIEEVIYCSRGIQNGASEIERVVDPKSSIFVGHESFDQSSSLFVSENLSSDSKISTEDDESNSVNVLNPSDTSESQKFAIKKPIAHNPSPICFEKYYREYMISSLPHLKVLDNLPIKKAEREQAKEIIKKYYEYIPYNRQYKESVVSILQKREMGRSGVSHKRSNTKHPYSRESSHSFTRSLSAAKMCSSPWPHLVQLSKIRGNSMEEIKTFRPRQFEYHPCNPSLMVFGTLDGELVVVNHESQKLIGYLPSAGAVHSILGLCWLKKYPSKLIAGSDNGSLKLYDVRQMSSAVTDRYCSLDASMDTFDEFDQLTSVHINSTDEIFLVSGFSNHVALYDIGSGKRLQFLKDLHREHINVVKFSHHSPSIFATASFDQDVKLWDLRQAPSKPCYTASSSRGNVMVCFSPDDHYLLASAVDNEVKQLLAVDGRLHTEFDIASIGSAQNYTRSYYMNGRDYVISGSCEENAVRICCAKTGRRLRDISVEGKGSKYSMFVQSLRGDPYRPFHMSVLAAYLRPCTKSEIIKVNLLATDDCLKEDSDVGHKNTLPGLGG